MRDKNRPTVKSGIKYAIEDGKMNVRMISGDHKDTCQVVALKAGIIKQDDLENENTIITSQRLEQICGTQASNKIDNDKLEEFKMVMEDCRVIYRAQPKHKLMVLYGLQQLERQVLITGDGVNDVESIINANIGIAMGSGCASARHISDMIITNDDFEATLRSIMWGRNIYQNLGRFLQF